jgi:SAM-dependent methyltransferase
MYDELGELYELWVRSDPACEPSRAFYVEQARRVGGPVLEVGSGLGRLTCEIAKAGIEIIGVEKSKAMYQCSLENVEKVAPELQDKVSFINTDILDLDSSTKAQLVLIPMRTIGLFLTETAQTALFQKLYDILNTGGVLIFDHFRFNSDVASRENKIEKKILEKDSDDSIDRLFHVHETDNANRILKCQLIHEVESQVNNKLLSRQAYNYELAWVTEKSISRIASGVGFKLRNLFGSFTGDGFEEDSDELVFVFSKE